jgi:hypothetical protein
MFDGARTINHSDEQSESMSAADPFDVLFAGLDKLGPGDDAHTRHVLRLLPPL